MKWENLREEEFDSAIKRSGGLCILPLGCLEKHGQHLPVGTDYIEAVDVIEEAAKLEDVVIFPTGAWLGEVSCFHAFRDPAGAKLRGCIGIKQSTLLLVLEELCDEIARNGFNKILIVNCHGGNIPMLKHFIRSQTYEGKPYATMSTFALDFSAMSPMKLIATVRSRRDEFSYVTDSDIEILKGYSASGYGGGHADFRETALIMAHDAALVAEDRYEAEKGSSNHRTDYLAELGVDAPNLWLANHPSSYDGLPPHGCNPRIGRAMQKVCSERLARIFKVLKEDNDVVAISKTEDLAEK